MRLVLDLSTSWDWDRPPVGIVRTEHRFAQHLLRSNAVPVSFCRYSADLACHVEVERNRACELVGVEVADADSRRPIAVVDGGVARATRKPLAPASAAATQPGRRFRAGAALKRAAHAVVHRLPETLRPQTVQTLKAGSQFAVGSARLARDWVRWARSPRTAPYSPPDPGARTVRPVDQALGDFDYANPPGAFKFQSDDVYMAMGLDWGFNNLSALHAQRRHYGFKSVLFCYDTIPVQFPQLMSFDSRDAFTRYFTDVAHTADRVVAISETSRRDFLALMEEVGGPQPPVDVVHLGTDLGVAEHNVRPPVPALESQPFVICVSTIEARKNHEVLYNAWDRLVARHGTAMPQLVIVGMVGWGVNDLLFRMRTNPRLQGYLRILDNVADGELAWLYRHALFSVFPSLYEGWGLPVVESLALGKPCICSTAPAVVEATQGLAITLDPLDTLAWIDAIERYCFDPLLRQQHGDRLRNFHAQTWSQHAAQLIDVARDVAAS